MTKLILFSLLVLSFFTAVAQTPQLTRDAVNGSKYIFVPEQDNNVDFRSVSQFRIGPYLTLGNFGYNNNSWIGNNAILNYSAYHDTGSSGNANKFVPNYAVGRALVINLDYSTADFRGYTYNWNNSTTAVDLNAFATSWILGVDRSYFAGNVGIGTTTPDSKLTVKGTIHTQEIKVDLSGALVPDYVFEEDYALPSLAETEIYIKANKHLPEVPSAKEMEETGMDLKRMNLLFLKKIEELTLYVIELKKENEELKSYKSAIDELAEKIRKLESR